MFHESVFPYASSSSDLSSSNPLPLPCAPLVPSLHDDPILSKPNSSALFHDSIIHVHHTIDHDFLDEVPKAPPYPISGLLILLQILFPLEGLLGLLKDLLICRSFTVIKFLLSNLCLLPFQVLFIPFPHMFHINTFLLSTRPSVVLFLLLLNLNSITKLCLIPNGKLPWLLK